MGNLFNFWQDCFVSAANIGHGVFGLVEIVLAFLWLFYGRKHNEKSQAWLEANVKKSARLLFLCLFFGALVVWMPYHKWATSEHDKIAAQTAFIDFNNSKPTPVKTKYLRLAKQLAEQADAWDKAK